MGDIDFEEQLELEKLEQEHKAKLAKEGKGERVDPDGTVYEWDTEKQAWFPKIDSDFIAQYQMNYGEESGGADGDKDKQTDYEKYYNYYQNYNQAQLQHEELLTKKKKEAQGDESHEETLQKLETLENRMQEQGDSGEQSGDYQPDSKEDMEKYTEDQKKQYNEYWSYYYSTDYHDYYADCMAQYASEAATEEKKEEDQDGKKKGKKRKGQPQQRDEGWFQVDDEHNTNVYVSGLPLDITMEEFKEMMTKYGLVMYDPRTRQPKMKLYMDENGQPRGDGRCCFIKKESVDLALNLLDGLEYKGHKIKAERAQFHLKGEYDPSKKKKKLTNKEKRRLKERQAKLFDWRPDKLRGARQKHEKVVVLKNVFDPKTFEDDPVQINILTRDMRTECTKYGEVKKVVVYDRHEDGVVTVHFKEPEEADMCIEHMNQRYFAQRRLLAATWDGQTKYEILETEAEREARLKKWEKFLETGEKEEKSANQATSSASNGSSVSTDSKSEDKTQKSEEESTNSSESAIAAEDSKTEKDRGVSDTKEADVSNDSASKDETEDVVMDTENDSIESGQPKKEEKT
ncbi:HIV Tat-specific factor 1-like isoform X2 [Mercenaria mercenaria]|uniref:HIV Tat-specific factor 1-like isoform X2 n=1 Tax=Mercenaria mercenaria TaxID=6596 RepID=UPI001E1DBF92|nr:HIV Tat-specific factor 1-like isoform X2 [Mercenaria mercenaria]